MVHGKYSPDPFSLSRFKKSKQAASAIAPAFVAAANAVVVTRKVVNVLSLTVWANSLVVMYVVHFVMWPENSVTRNRAGHGVPPDLGKPQHVPCVRANTSSRASRISGGVA